MSIKSTFAAVIAAEVRLQPGVTAIKATRTQLTWNHSRRAMGMTIRRLATAAKVGGATDLQPKAYPNTVAFVVPSPGRTLTSDREGQSPAGSLLMQTESMHSEEMLLLQTEIDVNLSLMMEKISRPN